MEENFSIINKTKERLPRLPFFDIKNDILKKKYELSIAFVDKKISRSLNKKYRGKDKATNVLSFSLNKNSGELVLCPQLIKTETKKFERNFPNLLLFLVIHGMLHLKGMEHGEKMEKLEEKYLSRTKFFIK
ncbi:MAG: putative rRNA maturation factor [Patescibacteria group bacterium]|nr:putative rRNA maturation factor [Patescibacteria group bacterium]